MEDAGTVAAGDGLAHLGEHGRDEVETAVGQKLGRVERGEEGRGWWSGWIAERRRGGLGSVEVCVVAGLFEEVEQILAGNVLDEEQEVRLRLKGTIQGRNVGVRRERLLDGGLGTERVRKRG